MREVKNLEFWIPKENIRKMKTADQAFADFSERGIKPDFENILNPYRYHELKEAKRQRGINVHELWEWGILDGSVLYWTLLGGENLKEVLPRNIVNFMKKEMFRGNDAETIESCYQKVLKYWTWWRRILFNFLPIKQ